MSSLCLKILIPVFGLGFSIDLTFGAAKMMNILTGVSGFSETASFGLSDYFYFWAFGIGFSVALWCFRFFLLLFPSSILLVLYVCS